MKTLLTLLLLVVTLSATHIKQTASNLNYVATSDYQCNLYLEYATNSLYQMAKAEESKNIMYISIHFNNYQTNVELAINYCNQINEKVTEEILDIHSKVTSYYLRNYYASKETK